MNTNTSIGATYLGQGKTRFTVWAPFREYVDAHVITNNEKYLPLSKNQQGYFSAIHDVPAGSLYYYRLDRQTEFPDPASRFQPQGVHGPSEVINGDFLWDDEKWSGLSLNDFIIYELHTGTFSEKGTFDAIIPHLSRLANTGISAIELMPVAQFPGWRNWGYDGVYPYSVQNSYGGPDGLKRLVNVCHQKNMAVILDVVYNHLGNEGNHLAEFGPYFTSKYSTPWGEALNFDGEYSDEVRRFFIENALYWIKEFHIDALRLDALHAIIDSTAFTFIEELSSEVHRHTRKLKRNIYLIGESSANDARLVRDRKKSGYSLDALWNDDFHHCVHTLLTGETNGYYCDFGNIHQMEKAYSEGFIYTGQYSVFRKRHHGTCSRDIPANRFIVFTQNHDQVGNRAEGERFSSLVSFESLKLAAGLVLLSPFIPLLFMGEEYGETAPFPYFISHSDAGLIEAVRRGRRQEFSGFAWEKEIPDPQDEATYLSAKLNHDLCRSGKHCALLDFYRELIKLRKHTPALSCLCKDNIETRGDESGHVLYIRRWYESSDVITLYNIGNSEISAKFPISPGIWHRLLDSSHPQWQGAGSTLAAKFESQGEIWLTLHSMSFIVIGR